MKLKIIKRTISLILFFIILIVYSNVFAYSMGVELNSNSTQLEANKEYTITASIVGNDTGDGISVITTKLIFDENVFDRDSITFTNTNGWTAMYYKKKDAIIIENIEKINKAEMFLTMNIKTKEDINIDSASLMFSELTASGGSEQNGGTGDLKFANDIGIVFNSSNGNIANKKNAQTKSSVSEEGTKEENSNKQKSNLVILIPIIALAVIGSGIVIFIKIKKNKNYK